MNKDLVLTTLAQCVDNVNWVIKDGENLSTPQEQLLQSVNETLQLVIKHISNDQQYEIEKACKNQAYDFILTERLLNQFKLFCSCYPVNTYIDKTGRDIISK